MYKVLTMSVGGMSSNLIEAEIDVASGIPGFSIVGLGDKAVSESKERVRSAIKHSRMQFPHKKITVNLSPADIKKEGSGYDLAIAVGILKAAGQLPDLNPDFVYFGELSLDGTIKKTSGLLSAAAKLYASNPNYVFVIPEDQADEIALLRGASYLSVSSLASYISFEREEKIIEVRTASGPVLEDVIPEIDFADVAGMELAKRALTIAAAGGHHVLLSGPPGSGKTLLSRAFIGLLPQLSSSEAIEVNSIYSSAGLIAGSTYLKHRPFRSPHHTSSAVALVGGGKDLKPGEITLAHRGVLFLDELPEFPRHVLETLREPLEEYKITVSRAAGFEVFPAMFQLIASQNPCPCGNFGSDSNICSCTMQQVLSYQKRISHALLDRIDLKIAVPPYKGNVFANGSGETTSLIRKKVIAARERQTERFGNEKLNARLGIKELKQYCALDSATEDLLNRAKDKMNLSIRSVHKCVKIARTIADLAGVDSITPQHVAEALQYRFTESYETAFA